MNLQRRMQVIDAGDTEDNGVDMLDTALKIAFATSNMKSVNQHFGSAKSFAIYAVSPDEVKLLEASEFGKLAQDGNEDKLAVKIQILEGCAAVYCHAAGSSAVRQLLMKGIQPVKVSENAEIKDLLESIRNEMRAGPSAWLAKAINNLKSPDMGRFDEMEAEGWDE